MVISLFTLEIVMLEDYFVRPDTNDRIRASWIAPAIEQIAPFVVGAATMAGGLRSCGTVIYNPRLAFVASADDDLVQSSVVVNPVDVVPELLYPVVADAAPESQRPLRPA